MSTKKKLIELVGKIAAIEKEEKKAFSQINAYEIAQDKPKLLKELSKLYAELERKKNTPITKELLLRNGFKEYPYGQFEYKEGYVEFDIEWDRGGCYWCDTVLRNVADLEDALALCGIDKDIEILK